VTLTNQSPTRLTRKLHLHLRAAALAVLRAPRLSHLKNLEGLTCMHGARA
jgi:hypothetical protein